ncbi:MAG: alkaline phosphatase [Gemmatimonadota bacterium]
MSSDSATVGRPASVAKALASWPSTASGRLLSLVLAFLVVNAVLLAPQWGAPGMVPFHWIAVEAWLVTLLFAALPRVWWSLVAALLVAALVVATGLIGLGDASTRMSLSRPLNLYLDVQLLSAVLNLLTGTLGPFVAALAGVLAVCAVLATVAVVGHLLAPPRRVRPLLWSRRNAVMALLTTGLVLFGARAAGGPGGLGFPAVRLAEEQARFLSALNEEREVFEAELSTTTDSYADIPGLFARLGGSDVVLAFVESYGSVVLDDPRYASVLRPRLEEMELRMAEAGLTLASGSMVAPSQGGQSWLGHGSVLSGLWLHNQMRYDLLLASRRETLIDDFRAAGYRTAALMPAITLAWPEGELFGYDEIYDFAGIGYAGPPLNWVTMPDQFTWSFLEHTIRRRDDERPLFAELGLISSHAPWTPILPVLEDWEGIGDGAVFEPWRDAGERPEDLWRDAERVREHFALSVDYAVHAATSYAERYVGSDMLLIILGDHQPAPLVTGDGAPRTVPVHVISGDPALVAPFLEWGFVPGAFPDPEADPPGMDQFRPWFVPTFSTPKELAGAGPGG